MELSPSAYTDTFCRDNLPSPELWPDLEFTLPETSPGRRWERLLDTSAGTAKALVLPGGQAYPLEARSLALLAYDRVPPLQQALARRGMGFRGEPPRAVLERVP